MQIFIDPTKLQQRVMPQVKFTTQKYFSPPSDIAWICVHMICGMRAIGNECQHAHVIYCILVRIFADINVAVCIWIIAFWCELYWWLLCWVFVSDGMQASACWWVHVGEFVLVQPYCCLHAWGLISACPVHSCMFLLVFMLVCECLYIYVYLCVLAHLWLLHVVVCTYLHVSSIGVSVCLHVCARVTICVPMCLSKNFLCICIFVCASMLLHACVFLYAYWCIRPCIAWVLLH